MGLLDYKDEEQSLKRAENRHKLESQANKLLKKKKKRRGKRKLKRPSKKKVPQMSYRTYIKSGYWRKRKKRYFKKYGKRCAVCFSTHSVQLHHKSYKYKFGAEPDEVLVALCRLHHYEFHKNHAMQCNMIKNTDRYIEEARQTYLQLQDSNIDDLSWI